MSRAGMSTGSVTDVFFVGRCRSIGGASEIFVTRTMLVLINLNVSRQPTLVALRTLTLLK